MAKHPRGEDHLHREIGVMINLYGHQHVIRMEAFTHTQTKYYLIMELASGGDMRDLLKKSPDGFEETVARRYFQELISAVWFCHANQVAHRDIKPENLLLSADGSLKLVDFGLSNVQKTNEAGNVPSALRLRTICGTPYYVAPEVCSPEARGYNGFQADIWSSAVVLYHMLLGKLPFVGSSKQSILKKIINDDPSPCPEVQESARDLMWPMMRKNPSQRATLKEIVEQPWFLINFDKSKLRETSDSPLPAGLKPG
eukprot:TRINITY_DN1724_c0_g1_i4.p1 TRINITY_DN1724_c0_g1~~TRINITY_DN1724_c0_g1_i4.p1  ORF type:complete len:255 (+),score=50.24 TRINITY_DN1724_c0_g1_i4:235-999(+)